jgi:hypothetical protein
LAAAHASSAVSRACDHDPSGLSRSRSLRVERMVKDLHLRKPGLECRKRKRAEQKQEEADSKNKQKGGEQLCLGAWRQ